MKQPIKLAACGLLAALVLAGCGGQNADSSVPVSSTTVESAPVSVPSQPEPASSEAPSAPSRPAHEFVLEYEGETTPVDENNAASLKGSWWYEFELDQAPLVFQYRFDETPGSMMFSYGVRDTDAGFYFNGPYTLQPDGIISANLKFIGMEEGEVESGFDIGIRVEFADDPNQAVFTLLFIETDVNGYREMFADIMEQPLLFERMV